MPTPRATTRFRFKPMSLDWWSRRPWADAMTWFDTAAFVPGPHNAAPKLRNAIGNRQGSLHVPARVKLVADDEAARLERARRSIGFTPTRGFLIATEVARLPRPG